MPHSSRLESPSHNAAASTAQPRRSRSAPRRTSANPAPFSSGEWFGHWVAEAVEAIDAGGAAAIPLDPDRILQRHYTGRPGTDSHPLDWAFDRVRYADRLLRSVRSARSQRQVDAWGLVRLRGLSGAKTARRLGVAESTVSRALMTIDADLEQRLEARRHCAEAR